MKKFEEFKIKVVMKVEHVSRKRAIEIIAERCKGGAYNDPVKKDAGVGHSSNSDECDLLSAEEFFGGK